MKKGIIFNLITAAIFIILNAWALRAGLEETFIVLAAGYAAATVISNALLANVNRKE